MTVMLFAEVVFELTAPAAVAAPERVETGATVHQPVARDGWGGLWIPPTSLAGHFRAHLGPDAAPLLMGEEPEGDKERDGEGERAGEQRGEQRGERPGRPSAVRFLATEVRLPDQGKTLHRTRTAIDRHRAAARASTLRTGEYLPPGTTVTCWLRVDGAEHHQGALDALRTWSPVVGGGRSTGFGSTRPVSVRYNTVDLGTPEGRRMWLTGGGRDLFTGEKHLTPKPATAPTTLLGSQWEIVDALHIGSGGRKNEAADLYPEQRSSKPAPLARDDRGQVFVPGTAWKGVLRGRCEYILGSLGLGVCVSSEGTCGTCAVCDAFGWSSDGPLSSREGDDRESVGARARLRFTDSPITGERLDVRHHVALDRFTGGARTGLLFAEEVAESGRVTLEVYAEGDAVHPVIAAALELALYDLHTGRLGLGGGTTRGYGTLRRTDADEDAIRERRDAAARVLASQLPGVDQPGAETTGMERKEPAC